ncbi:MAG: GAF domain-containing protein [Deltaproteobacteria bacterium]|nr:GAF domain-containing protein [Deltaproteobacteria bacterium]
MLVNHKYISIKINDSKMMDRNRELSILLEMSNLLSTSRNLKTLLTKALSTVMAYFDLEAGRIYLMDDKDPYMYLAAHQGMEAEGLEKLSLNEGFSGKAVRTKCFIAQHVSELEDKDRAAFLSKMGLKIIICVPLISMDKVGGVMNLGSEKIIRLDQNKIDLLTTIGNQIAIAADNAKYYEELQHKIKALKEKQEMIKFFTYSVSHDLKSPAIGIYGLTRRLQEKYIQTLDEKGKVYCNQILNAARQMVDLVEKINEYIAAKEAP